MFQLILSERFSQNILENEKCLTLITSTCHSFDKKYNKYLEELSQGWDKYNFEKMNILENKDNEEDTKDNSYFFTNFRKHCHKTQNILIFLLILENIVTKLKILQYISVIKMEKLVILYQYIIIHPQIKIRKIIILIILNRE